MRQIIYLFFKTWEKLHFFLKVTLLMDLCQILHLNISRYSVQTFIFVLDRERGSKSWSQVESLILFNHRFISKKYNFINKISAKMDVYRFWKMAFCIKWVLGLYKAFIRWPTTGHPKFTTSVTSITVYQYYFFSILHKKIALWKEYL